MKVIAEGYLSCNHRTRCSGKGPFGTPLLQRSEERAHGFSPGLEPTVDETAPAVRVVGCATESDVRICTRQRGKRSPLSRSGAVRPPTTRAATNWEPPDVGARSVTVGPSDRSRGRMSVDRGFGRSPPTVSEDPDVEPRVFPQPAVDERTRIDHIWTPHR